MRVLLKGTDKANLYCDWSSVQDIAKNQSTITLSMVVAPLTIIGSWTDFNGSYLGTQDMTFNGTIPNISSERIIATKKLTVTHDEQGKKTQLIKWKWGVNSPWGGFENPSGQFNIVLPLIARASIPTVDVSSQFIGQNIVIQTNKVATVFRHTLRYKLGLDTGTIATDVSNQKTWALPLNLCNQLPNDTSGTLTIYCDTYNGMELVGTKAVKITVKVPNDIIPTIYSITTTEQELSNKLGVFVKNISKVGVDIRTMGAYSSTITTVTATFNGVTYKGNSFSLGTLKQSGVLTVKIIDSRGRINTSTKAITCVDYYAPKISAFKVERCNSDGVINTQGEYAKVTYDYRIAQINALNAKSIVISYKQGSGAYTSLLTLNEYASSGEHVTTEKFDINLSYDFKFELKDSFNSRISNYLLSSDSDTIIDIKLSGNGIAFGGVAEEENTAKFNFNIKNVSDTAWLDISLASTFKAYDTEQIPQYRVRLGTIELRGAISPLTAFSSNATRVTFGNIPTQLAPSKPIYVVCQGSGKNTWLLTVATNGELQISRYGITSYAQVETTAWLTFQTTYTID